MKFCFVLMIFLGSSCAEASLLGRLIKVGPLECTKIFGDKSGPIDNENFDPSHGAPAYQPRGMEINVPAPAVRSPDDEVAAFIDSASKLGLTPSNVSSSAEALAKMKAQASVQFNRLSPAARELFEKMSIPQAPRKDDRRMGSE